MSAIALLAAATTQTPADEIRNVAGLASLTLGLIGFFTNLRFSTFKSGTVPALSLKTIAAALPELLLLAVAVVALVAMAPLLDAFDIAQLGHRAGALPTLFALIWVGFAFIALVEVYLIVIRVRLATRNLRAEREAAAAAV